MTRSHFPLFALATLLALPLPCTAQRRDDGLQFEDFVEVSEILLDVLVTDKKGHVVTGLGNEDFLVTENGEPVPITAVSFYTTRYDLLESLPENTRGDEIPWSRFFIVLFQDQQRLTTPANRLLQQQLDAGRKLRRWVAEEMLPSDWMAVLSYDVRLRVHQDFTQDREALDRAVDEAVTSKNPRLPTPSERDRMVASGPSLWRHLPAGPDLGKRTKVLYDALRLIGEASGYIVGRKNLIYFGIGLGDPGSATFHSRPDPRYYPDVEHSLNHNNVAVYPIDVMPTNVEHLGSGGLNQLAADTGGEYFKTFIDFRSPLRNISEENSGYYLLSYQTEHPAGESGYREIKVKLKDKKLRAKTRRGYLYGTGE